MRKLVKCKEVSRGRITGGYQFGLAVTPVFEDCKVVVPRVLGRNVHVRMNERLYLYIECDDMTSDGYLALHLFVLNGVKTYIEYILLARNLNLKIEAGEDSVKLVYDGFIAVELSVFPDGSVEFEDFGDLVEDLGASDSLEYAYTFCGKPDDTYVMEQWRGDFYKIGFTDDMTSVKPDYCGVINKRTGKRIMFNDIMGKLDFVSGTDEFIVLEGEGLRYKVMFPEGDELTYKVCVYNPQ